MTLMPFFDRSENVGVLDFDSPALDASSVDQVPEQGAVAAAEVKNTVSWFDPAGDHFEIRAVQGMAHSLIFRR
jgi:hypothetical protein